MGNRIVYLGCPLQHMISNISVNVYHHLNDQSDIVINILDYFPNLKQGLCYETCFYRVRNAYFKLISTLKSDEIINLVKKSFGSDIMMSGDKSINTYQYHKLIDNDFNPDSYGIETMNNFRKYNIHDNISDENINKALLINEDNMADELLAAIDLINPSNELLLFDILHALSYSHTRDNLLINLLLKDNRIKLYVAIIISNKELVCDFLKIFDPRDHNNTAFFLSIQVFDKHKSLSDKICSLNDKNCSSDDKICSLEDNFKSNTFNITNIIRNDIIIRNWYEKQVLINEIDPVIGPSSIPDNLQKYIRQLI